LHGQGSGHKSQAYGRGMVRLDCLILVDVLTWHL
jgi:hypothetical protein